MRVTQLVESPLDPGLFTVPTGFRQVKQIDRDPPPNPPNPWSMAWNRFKSKCGSSFPLNLPDLFTRCLNGRVKSGQRWSGQNRPTDVARDSDVLPCRLHIRQA